VLIEEGRILLARRRSSLFDGMWCIPCGYVEIDESVQEAARREFREETGLEVEVGEVQFVHSGFEVAHRPVVGIWFRGRAVGGELAPGSDVRELAFFPLDAPPTELAFEGDRLVIDMLRQEASERGVP
jgi:8-oxo-dGTP diphosphatase